MIADEIRALAEEWPLTGKTDSLRALADRVEAVERDAARYRCWRDRTVASNQPAAKCDDWLYSAMDDNNADTLDARVDAALKEQADANS